MDYDTLFRRATGLPAPYPYQRRLALSDWPAALRAPTGAGKTAAVVLGWLYKRRFAPPEVRAQTPRRLVLCLPMRTLVDQTVSCAERWLRRLDLLDAASGIDRGDGVSVHLLLGGEADQDFQLHPERDAIIVGTQDMLLSRALNRGYGCSRFLWPWHFALLSNDCLWVFDEVQLMGAGLATGRQLLAFRNRLGVFGPHRSLFMSATLEPSWLRTVDQPAPEEVRELAPEDLACPELRRRRMAPKRLQRADNPIGKKLPPSLADEVVARHRPGSRTLVVLNTVQHALDLHHQIDTRIARTQLPQLLLLHGRFRPGERTRALQEATAEDFSGIIVSTQVIEAGVDLSAQTLFTELAPWASLVQRAGRCNRHGEYADAAVFWIDHAEGASPAPYEAADLDEARQHLQPLSEFNPQAIEEAGVVPRQPPPAHVLRRRDLLDLFDTTAELGGLDIDVSRFIREGDDHDAQVFWRAVDRPGRGEPRPSREELCPVPATALRAEVERGRAAFRWDPLAAEWQIVRREQAQRMILPGAIYLLRAAEGGYDPARGWDPGAPGPAPTLPLPPDSGPEEEMDGDPLSELHHPVALHTHAEDTAAEAERILAALDLKDVPAGTVVRAARLHDIGKAHPVFQDTMRRCGAGDGTLWAKAGRRGLRHARRGFRHELASALAWLQAGEGEDQDLVAYLLASHHGKVRLSLRALPGDEGPDEPERLHARGIWEGDELPALDLGERLHLPGVRLSLALMLLGRQGDQPSWTERVIALRDRLGPFRLAFLEALVRAADWRASMRRDRKGGAP